MNWIKENWFKVAIIIVLVFASTFLFYWHEWRPREIRKECYSETYGSALKLPAFGKEAVENQKIKLEYNYKKCLLGEGTYKPTLNFGF